MRARVLHAIQTDGSNAFAHHSMTVRVPDILGDVLRLNPDYTLEIQRAIEALSNEIRANAKVPSGDVARAGHGDVGA